jgi:hypothetical protein
VKHPKICSAITAAFLLNVFAIPSSHAEGLITQAITWMEAAARLKWPLSNTQFEAVLASNEMLNFSELVSYRPSRGRPSPGELSDELRIAQRKRLERAGFDAEEIDILFRHELVKTPPPDTIENLLDIERDLLAFGVQDPAQAAQLNEDVIRRLNRWIPRTEPKRLAGLEPKEMDALYKAVGQHPVASLAALDKYETEPLNKRGFCFGRAAVAHLEALAVGVSKSAIRKVWAVGNFDTGDGKWKYHVATIVRGTDGLWYAIEPEMGGAVELSKWTKWMSSIDVDKNMRIHVTSARRSTPTSDGSWGYTKGDWDHPFYNGYFKDFREVFESEVTTGKKRLWRTGKKPD